jgi:hypothetical protein
MNWVNLVDSVKFIQSNSKKWIQSDNWVDMDLEKEKLTKNRVMDKTRPNPKNPLTQ